MWRLSFLTPKVEAARSLWAKSCPLSALGLFSCDFPPLFHHTGPCIPTPATLPQQSLLQGLVASTLTDNSIYQTVIEERNTLTGS